MIVNRKFNLQLFAEPKVEDEKNDNEQVEDNKEQGVVEDKAKETSMLETMQKQIDLLKQSLENSEKKRKEAEEEAEKKVFEEKKKYMNEEQLKEAEAESKRKEELEKQNELLEAQDKLAKELEEMKKENKKKEFENRKLQDSQKYPWIADKIGACKEETQLEFLHSITNHKTEEAKWKAENSKVTGSVLNVGGVKSADEVAPQDPIELSKKRLAEKESLMKKKLMEQGYRLNNQ